jgi:cobalt/nickel transport system permease protein
MLAALPPILALALAGRLRPDGSWELAGLLALRGVFAVGAALLLVARLSEIELLLGLRALGAPRGALAVIAGMLRQRRSLERERRALALALEARTLRTPTVPERWSGAAAIAARIFVRSLVRAEQVGMAMAARGWTGAELDPGRPHDPGA